MVSKVGRILWGLVVLILATQGSLRVPETASAQVVAGHGLRFPLLARHWDEAIPLGNGLVGALVWQQGNELRFSLDRADLWDLRPVKEFQGTRFRFAWIRQQVLRGDYGPVQELSDLPYERDPGPSKIPAGALQFDLSSMGEVESVQLHLRNALCEVKWKSGAVLRTYVHATRPVGWFQFEDAPADLTPEIAPPPYGGLADAPEERRNSVEGNDLRRLGYPKPEISRETEKTRYHQEGQTGFSYDIEVRWKRLPKGQMVGMWIVASQQAKLEADQILSEISRRGIPEAQKTDWISHQQWWHQYWSQSSIVLPDSILENQWYRELYKLGSASRRGAPPISLQAVWTADNGRIPPWKGDFHHDLNTELSYWPCYSANHLEEGLAYLDWLWHVRPSALKFTRMFFDTDGLNVPGVTTLTGEPMGGWAQYSLSPTVSAWLAHHFYLHWRYSADREFLEKKAYPWISEVALFLDRISVRGSNGQRKLPLSSSPEINDNRIDAWFQETTNYDLALIRWLYGAAAELAGELGKNDEASGWRRILSEWPGLALSPEDRRLLVAPGIPLKQSHRHFSHLMAIHPLGLVDWANSPEDRQTIRAALTELERLGPSQWCGYSYSWLGNLAARARDGDRAARALRIFADCFCLPNSFHANGDQSGTGKSNFTYRPFTLEGNFAFAAGVQEMLLQSQNGMLRLFSAIPSNWMDVSFKSLRAQGAFLVSATKFRGEIRDVTILSEQGGRLRLANPFSQGRFGITGTSLSAQQKRQEIIEIDTRPGMVLQFSRK